MYCYYCPNCTAIQAVNAECDTIDLYITFLSSGIIILFVWFSATEEVALLALTEDDESALVHHRSDVILSSCQKSVNPIKPYVLNDKVK